MFDKPGESCGIFGVFGHPEAANLTYLGLYSLQHRGQESAGIVSGGGRTLHYHIQMGLVADVFKREVFKKLPGESAIGHVRYSTTGSSELKNAQPFMVEYARGKLAVAHNGNLVNAQAIREELEANGSLFRSSMDTETIVHLMATSKKGSLVERIIDALQKVSGAYCLVFLTNDRMIAVRDPRGFRPLVLGRLRDAYIISSESCALNLIEAEYLREVEPGEILVFTKDKMESLKPFAQVKEAHCIFEYIYFARPDSVVFGKNVYNVRRDLGRQLAREHPVEADIVVPVPDSGVPAAIGYSEQSGIPFQLGIIRNHYVGRTFIEPRQSIRHFGVKIKLNALKEVIQGKRVIVIDDSIIRGTTSQKIVAMIRAAGAKEVHMRISSPPTTNSCFYGIDTPTRRELIASTHRIEEINEFLSTDSLGYLSIEGLLKAAGGEKQNYCVACFNGDYPIKIPRRAKPSRKSTQRKI
jgi:amidophosphoribosyltransferase